MWIRHVLVPERSDNDEYLKKLDAFIQTLSNVEKVEVLPYHTLGEYKWKELGMEYPLEGIEPPTEERIRNANELLHTGKIKKKSLIHPPEMMSDTFYALFCFNKCVFSKSAQWT